jgi:hypothetical protein
MQKESALKLGVVGVAACAAVFLISASAPGNNASFLLSAPTSTNHEFLKFIAQYGKNYATSDEFNLRLATFN